MYYSPLRYAHCSNSNCPAHCKRSYPLQKMGDGRCHLFFAAPFYTVPLGVKRSVKSQAGRATSSNALCRGFDPCRQHPRDVAVDFGPNQFGWLINQLGKARQAQFKNGKSCIGPELGQNHPLFRLSDFLEPDLSGIRRRTVTSLMFLAHARTWSYFQVLPSSSEIHSVQAVRRTICQPCVSEGLQMSAVSRACSGRRDRLMKDKDSFRPDPEEAVQIKTKPLPARLTAINGYSRANYTWARCWVLRATMAVTMAQTLMQGRMALSSWQ
jgi:hypothetical protein